MLTLLQESLEEQPSCKPYYIQTDCRVSESLVSGGYSDLHLLSPEKPSEVAAGGEGKENEPAEVTEGEKPKKGGDSEDKIQSRAER